MICYILILATIFSLSIMVANREATVIFFFLILEKHALLRLHVPDDNKSRTTEQQRDMGISCAAALNVLMLPAAIFIFIFYFPGVKIACDTVGIFKGKL